MATEYVDDLEHHDVIRDVTTGELAILSNGICMLCHSSTEGYLETHTDGCKYVPYEGYVFEGPAHNLGSWSLKNIQGRRFVKVSPEVAKKVTDYFNRHLENIEKGRKCRSKS